MLVSDVRWPSLREAARRLIRYGEVIITVPHDLLELANGFIDSISENDPARTQFPVVKTGIPFIGTKDEEIVRLGGEEPELSVCWIEGEEVNLWRDLFAACDDLLEAGYPGCVGCGGPDAEGEWNEEIRRSEMLKNSIPE